MNKKTTIILICLAVFYGLFYWYVNRDTKEVVIVDVPYSEIPSIGMTEEYAEYEKTFKTYESSLGFSFKYPPHLFVWKDPEATIERLVLIPNSVKDNPNDIYGVVVSVGLNDENMTPLEWLKSKDSGADLSEGYEKVLLDGQDAIFLEHGTWVVVNTPDNKYRLSIALLPGENGNLLFTEEGVVLSSLKFNK